MSYRDKTVLTIWSERFQVVVKQDGNTATQSGLAAKL